MVPFVKTNNIVPGGAAGRTIELHVDVSDCTPCMAPYVEIVSVDCCVQLISVAILPCFVLHAMCNVCAMCVVGVIQIGCWWIC